VRAAGFFWAEAGMRTGEREFEFKFGFSQQSTAATTALRG
jgi:hypothetical protein